MADHEVFEEPSFVLQKGAMLPVARLAYKTVGALNAARDNAVLVPSWSQARTTTAKHTC
jgi:homoserine O-acetyltransferase